MKRTFILDNEHATQQLAETIADACKPPFIIYLQGNLGTGKTTFVRYFLRRLGIQGTIKSPTYGIVESYSSDTGLIHHFDCYRLMDSEELSLIGLRDYMTEDAICLFEWPEKGQDMLPQPDLLILFDIIKAHRQLTIIGDTVIVKRLNRVTNE